ncbi:MAG: NADH-quinone oxidoreductase subunit NuoK [Bacteroidia bacterium]
MEGINETLRTIPLNWYVMLCSVLFSIGVMGVMLRRNIIIIFMCIELMLNSVNLLFTAFSAYSGNPAGQVFVFFVMVVAAAEIAVGLALLVMIYRNIHSVDINELHRLKW